MGTRNEGYHTCSKIQINIIKMKLNDVKIFEAKTRKMRIHHRKSVVDRLYVERALGERGLIQLELI